MKSKGASFENYQIEQKRYDMESREKTGKPTKISPGGLFFLLPKKCTLLKWEYVIS